MKKIAIYSDEGTDPFSVISLVESLKEEGFSSIYLVDRNFFDQEWWPQKTDLLIFPGGRDLPYLAALSGKRNQSISHFIEQGGQFLGICAGAYYASAHVEFEKGGPLEVVGKRELSFFKGTAQGPALGLSKFRYGSQSGSQIAKLSLPDGSFCFAYYNGGCAFIGEEKGTQVLARYADVAGSPPAVIRCPVGKGTATLCGVHLEYRAYHAHTSQEIQGPLLESLAEIDQKMLHRTLWQTCLKSS